MEEESINHLIIHYAKASFLWKLVFSQFGVTRVMRSTIRDNLLSCTVLLWERSRRKLGRSPSYVCFELSKSRQIGGHLLSSQMK